MRRAFRASPGLKPAAKKIIASAPNNVAICRSDALFETPLG